MNLIQLINEAITTSIPTDEELRAAAETQRDIPESTMLKTVFALQKRGGSAVFNDLLEHVGDLSHRLQEPGGIGFDGVGQKLRKLNKLLFPPAGWMNLEQEMEHALEQNAEFLVAERHPEIPDDGPRWQKYETVRQQFAHEIEAQKEDTKKAYQQFLPAYVQAHEQHNKPITYAGQLGKQAAIDLGRMDFDALRRTARTLTDYFQLHHNNPEMIFKRIQ